MAITLNAPAITKRSAGGTPFCANGTSADMSGNEVLKAAPGVGYQLRIKSVHINCAVATTVVINAATAAVVGPFSFGAAAAGLSNVNLTFPEPLGIGENVALHADAGGAGAVNVVVTGDIVRVGGV